MDYPNDIERGLPDHHMIRIVGGRFRMGADADDSEAYGDEKPAHEVRIGDFYLAKFPVTQSLWKAVMGKNPSRFPGDRRPVEQVPWEDAQIFIQKLNARTGRTTPGQGYRLPTEAEWEYAARGGADSQGYRYAGSDKLSQVGWYNENSDNQTQEVGQKYPNELGLYDLSGNVLEWVEDDWHDDYKGAPNDGSAWTTANREDADRVLRGAHWLNNARYCRVSCRSTSAPAIRGSRVGFRLALSLQLTGKPDGCH